MFLCIGLDGPIPSPQLGPFDELTSTAAGRMMNPRKGSGRSGRPQQASPRLGPRRKSDKLGSINLSNIEVVCKQCGKHFTDLAKYKTHEAYHSQMGRFVCEYCGKAFHTNVNKLAHERVHTGERPFKCSVCNKGFITNENCKRHESTHFR